MRCRPTRLPARARRSRNTRWRFVWPTSGSARARRESRVSFSNPAALRADELLEAVAGSEGELGLLLRPGVGEDALDTPEPEPVGGGAEEPGADSSPAEVLSHPQVADVAPTELPCARIAVCANVDVDVARQLIV